MAASVNKLKDAQDKNIILPVSIRPTAWRVEIDEFLADTKMTNLFLLALDKMQQASLGMLGAEELEKKKRMSPGPLEAKDKVDWWTYYNLSGRPTLLWLYIHDLTFHRHSWPSPRELAWCYGQNGNRVRR